MTLAEQYIAHWQGMEKEAASVAGAKEAVSEAVSAAASGAKKGGSAVHGHMGDTGVRMADIADRIGEKFGGDGVRRGAVGQHIAANKHAYGYGAHGVAAAGAVGGGMLLKKLLSRKQSAGQKLVGAIKNNRKAILGTAAAGAGAAGLAAFMKKKNDK